MNTIEEVIYPALDSLKNSEGLKFTNTPDLVLFGNNAVLDSLMFIDLLVEIQNKILTVTGREIGLANPSAIANTNSPFRTVSTMANYIDNLLK